MTNEILLVLTLIAEFSGTLLFYHFFGKTGLYIWAVVATIAANIEVLILINAFGIEMTLGNILFATTFLVTDILSENYGKKAAKKAVMLSTTASVCFIIISISWLYYIPGSKDFASESIRSVFSYTPRIMISSLAVYVIVQFFDVWLYHKLWNMTIRKAGNKPSFLWLRNNGATLVSQLLNTVLYNLLAFGGIYPSSTLITIIFSGYAIFAITSIADTPFIYLSRRIHPLE